MNIRDILPATAPAPALTLPVMGERMWPDGLERALENPRALACEPGPYPWLCPNCGGHRIMAVYVAGNGPLPTPGRKSKWLDLAAGGDPRRPSVSGWYDGELLTAPCPECCGNGHEYLRRNCGLSEADFSIRLEDFRINHLTEGKRAAGDFVKALLGQEPRGFVTLHGDYGVGKSHLLKGLVNGFWRVGVRCRYAVLSDLIAEIRERFGDAQGVVAVEQAVDALAQVPVLCLDEVGDSRRLNLTGWANETTFKLLDRRYGDRENVLTVLASNIAPERMAPEWGYLRSRISGGVVIEVRGPDMREYDELMRQARITGGAVEEE